MIARVAGFDTRAELGLAKPRSRSTNIRPEAGGVMTHYWGVTLTNNSHEDCQRIWRGGQKFHFGKEWADLAYNAGFCDHGYILAGRGDGVRSAANGTNDANDRYLAYVYIGGPGNKPTQKALDALAWLVAEARVNGAGREAKTHADVRPTSCAGAPIIAATRRLDGDPIALAGKKPAPAAKPSVPTVKPAPAPKRKAPPGPS